MKPERIQDSLKTFPAWSYRQIDELHRSFTLDSYAAAVHFVIKIIELAEDLELEPALSLHGREVSVHLSVPEEGFAWAAENFVRELEELRRPKI